MRLRSILNHVNVSGNLRFLLGKGRYRYTVLPSPTSIRLLELLPASKNDADDLTCRLKSFELHDAPPFHALSYTWGSPLVQVSKSLAKSGDSYSTSCGPQVTRSFRRHPIICDGQIIKVTSNLRDALNMLASRVATPDPLNGPMYYWIDALCINQSNVEERNAQVTMMGKIFAAAESVIVWLGKKDDFTLDAVTTVKRVAAIPEEEWGDISYTSFYDSTTDFGQRRPDLSYYNWLGFVAFINRAWFKRAWIVQEIALAKKATIVCGNKVLSWDELSHTMSFLRATKWYHHLRTEKLKHVKVLQKSPGIYKRILQAKLEIGVGPIYVNAVRLRVAAAMISGHLESNKLLSLRILLEIHRFSQSTDPRDKIYAFLGLADKSIEPFQTQSKSLIPNYNRSVQQVYSDVARALLISNGTLSTLEQVQDPSRTKIPDLPSWVPDYSIQLKPYPLRLRGPTVWTASDKRTWRPNILTLENGLLDVQGFRLDCVHRTALVLDESKDPSAMWASYVKLALSLTLPYPNPTRKSHEPSRVELLWRTLCTDTYNKVSPAPPDTGTLFIDYVLNLQIRHRLMPWSRNEEFQPHFSPLSESIYPEWGSLFALEPDSTKYSLKSYKDRLMTVIENTFNGTYSPVELSQLQHDFDQGGGKQRRLFSTQSNFLGTGPRSLKVGDEVWILNGGPVPYILRPQSNGNYRLIGEAFVYGVMHGEALTMRLQEQQISIE
ncbi:HET-domain-containing protein [Aaosphaeria arxii CBS 175.79]|uniref:HET-domain-containing protein n=1 Tax=Aaosphaeria arxii CBS 175.79 TaxID=1450172 RepID=A0A6A5XXX3_9PLEO|nr:HET-domain-containing protein [Aaosphaeria arxii CBS 175.79]KAF2017677.1 HET-domain-containing protein [Aaosphaeria arxii CBS 175.79]